MPPNLFAQDPRILKAEAYLTALGDTGPLGRPPNTGPDPLEALLGEIVDLRPVDASKMVLDWDLIDPVLEARHQGLLGPDDSPALNAIVRDWLVGQGLLPAPPDETH